MSPILLDLTHTSHTRARTGIQRVTRSLHAALRERALAITHDPHQGAWRPLQAWEKANLAADSAAAKRSAAWPLRAKLAGRAKRLFSGPSSPVACHPSLRHAAGIVVPEVFSPAVATALPALFAATKGPRVAVFHDAIALKFPELTPGKTVARFPAYLQELLAFDGIAAVSNDSRDSLLAYWQWLGVRTPPPVRTIPLGIDPPGNLLNYSRGRATDAASVPPVVLSVGSIEGRKNHLALLDACESLWARGSKFELHLIGLAQTQTGRAALARIRELQARGRPLRYDGPVNDAALETAYAGCAFTVYPSLIEGFGLPVLESVARGKPCICSARGALGESAAGGGTMALASVDAAALADAIDRLLRSAAERGALAEAARRRVFRSWQDYADELMRWLRELPRRD